MSTLRVTTVTNPPGGQPTIDGLARAWVNFNGTGTVAIRASLNVSSITDNGTGDYTVNFTTALADANYSVAGMTAIESGEADVRVIGVNQNTTQSATQLRVTCFTSFSVRTDRSYVYVSVFR
jgi:hypothetical protein